ncbi:MAG: hypothetical protein R2749_12800 [Acidimicrobiales bacterium]
MAEANLQLRTDETALHESWCAPRTTWPPPGGSHNRRVRLLNTTRETFLWLLLLAGPLGAAPAWYFQVGSGRGGGARCADRRRRTGEVFARGPSPCWSAASPWWRSPCWPWSGVIGRLRRRAPSASCA